MFNCKTSKFLNSHAQLAEFLATAPDSCGSQPSRIIPFWLQLHLLIAATSAICLPHESADWTRDEYMRWFNEHTAGERAQFLTNFVRSYDNARALASADATTKTHLERMNAILEESALQNQ